jgi:hypothetical protein
MTVLLHNCRRTTFLQIAFSKTGWATKALSLHPTATYVEHFFQAMMWENERHAGTTTGIWICDTGLTIIK